MKEALADIDDVFTAQQGMRRPPPPSPPQKDLTFGVFQRADGRLGMGNKVVHIEDNTLKVDDKEYKLTPGLRVLILYKKPRHQHYSSVDYSTYKALVAQTWVRAFPNTTTGSTRPHSTWKWKHMLKNMVVPGDRVDEESEDSDTGIGSSQALGQSSSSVDSGIFSTMSSQSDFSPISPRSSGKAKKKKSREAFYKGCGVVYLPGDITGLTEKLHLLAAAFFAGNTTVRNELVHVLDVLLRLKQLTRKEYTDITACLATV